MGLSDADAGLEHEPDDRLVAAVMERLAGARVGVSQVAIRARRSSSVSGVTGFSVCRGPLTPANGSTGRCPVSISQATKRRTASWRMRTLSGCRAGLQHVAHPGGHRGPGQGRLERPGAPGQVGLEAVGVGVDRAGALGLGTQRLLPLRQECSRVVNGELGELGEVVHAATTPRPRRPRPSPRFSVSAGAAVGGRTQRCRATGYPRAGRPFTRSRGHDGRRSAG